MRLGRNGLPRHVKCGALLVLTFIAPLSALAPSQPAGASDGAATQAGSGDKPAGGILDLDIEQLARTPVVVPSMDVPVTSVTKELSTVGRSAAAVFVITNEMIRRSGVTCIPDALRMAPGMEVAQINSSTWAITCRGFNSSYASKLLVLIDGRTVYNPDFAGVFWNVQDVVLEDVERIEVVRGPGGTLWGANAVNGVINIITKRAKDTGGVYVQGGGGSHEREMEAVRYGGVIGDDLHYRIYGKHFERSQDFDPAGLVDDAWRQRRFGFRADWEPGRDASDVLTVQGDHYDGASDGGGNGLLLDPASGEVLTGDNLLVRWRHVYDEDSDWSLQVYYDRYLRDNLWQTQSDKTYDVEFQRRFPLADRHSITWGAGFRSVESLFVGGDQFITYYATPYSITNYSNQFAQDQITLIEDRLTFTLGCKLEQNPYVGLEYQPTARLLWSPDPRHAAWAAFSRAVHTPTRSVEQIRITLPPYSPGVYPRVMGRGGLLSESVLAYEIGYREQTTKRFSWDVATFYNAYDHLLGVLPGSPEPEPPPPDPPERLIVPLWVNSTVRGETYGVEWCGNYAVSERWTLYAQYTMLQVHLSVDPPNTVDPCSDPHNQVYLRSAWSLSDDLDFDLMARYVDSLTGIGVPRYLSMDLRLAWRPRKHLELAVVGQNLLQEYHWEYAGGTLASPTYATEVPRGVYGTVSWRY